MKKQLSVIFCILAFVMAGCAIHGKKYALDVDATAASGWAVGDKVIEGASSCFMIEGWQTCALYRKFLGVTQDGHYLVQDFYKQDDVKMTDPYLLLKKDEVLAPDFNPLDMQIEGRFVKWHPNGQKWYQGQFEAGKLAGVWMLWHGNGQKAGRGEMNADREQGKWTYWHENGQKKAEGSFVNGKQDGLWTQWYESGKKRTEVTFLVGKAHGLWTEWYESGAKKAQGGFVMDKPVGVWREWDESGKLLREENRDNK